MSDRVQVKQLQKTIEKALDAARDADEDASVDELKHARAVVHGHGPGGDMRKLIKSRNPKLLTLLLGANTRVVTMQVCLLMMQSVQCARRSMMLPVPYMARDMSGTCKHVCLAVVLSC